MNVKFWTKFNDAASAQILEIAIPLCVRLSALAKGARGMLVYINLN
jgi:hypothetical protein